MSHTCNLVLNNQSLSRILYFKSSFVTILFCFSLFFFVRPPRKVCIANRNIGQKFVFLKQIYFSYSSLCCLFYQARHRRWDQSAVSILVTLTGKLFRGNLVHMGKPRERGQLLNSKLLLFFFGTPYKTRRFGYYL